MRCHQDRQAVRRRCGVRCRGGARHEASGADRSLGAGDQGVSRMTAEKAWFGRRDPDARGYYGAFGGRFVPETLVAPIEALDAEYLKARQDPSFAEELSRLLTNYV